jgi:hypothetical protein
VSFANIVYNDERTSIAVRLRNPAYSPLVLRAVAKLRKDGETQILVNSLIPIGAQGENFVIIPVDMKQLSDKRADVSLDLTLGKEVLDSKAIRLIPSPERLADLEAQLGGLYDSEGCRIMIGADLEDPDRHMRWVFAKYLRDEVYARHAGTRTNILLFGDRMTNPVEPNEEFTDYVTRIRRHLKEEGRDFRFVARTEGLLPTIADVARFAKTLESLDEIPDIVVISPGLADVAQATGQRDFARSIDVMIDCVRATGKRVKIVVVSPPPFPRNRRLSRNYTEALETVARKHHVAFLNLDRLLAEPSENWERLYYASSAEGVFYKNPGDLAHRRIASALMKLLH